MDNRNYILTLNAGSSSIKLALFSMIEGGLSLFLSGKITHIGTGNAVLVVMQNDLEEKTDLHASDFNDVIKGLIPWLEKQAWFEQIQAVGHRIVYGMNHDKADIVTKELLNEFNRFISFDPDHLPAQIAIIESLCEHYPHLLQITCYDTAFHHALPDVAKTFAIPKKYTDEGIRRYGFHGISYSYLLQEIERINAPVSKGRIIMAHLGNGASLAAIKNGKCIDTSMGFTPAGGIVMSSRSGDLDPGIAWFLMQKNTDVKTFNNIINHESGLLGISGISSDMQVLLERASDDKDAALAIDIFCYQIKKYIGAYTAALDGLDVLVFSGGIGENAPQIRHRICEGLHYAGIEIDEQKNDAGECDISSSSGKVKVYVIPTNEELMIARLVSEISEKEAKNKI